jgi:NADH:ubiquinone oxidoreductase subunit 6 (subunit J)
MRKILESFAGHIFALVSIDSAIGIFSEVNLTHAILWLIFAKLFFIHAEIIEGKNEVDKA